MAKLKITQPGMETYSGMMGDVEFVEGESTHHVTRLQAQRIAGACLVETLEGEDPSAATEYAIVVQGGAPSIDYTIEPSVNASSLEQLYDYTRESLEQIADATGLAGLRVVADKHGVKSNSIISMIEKLMELSGEQGSPSEA